MLLTDSLNEQYRALLEVTESIAVHYDLAELFRDLVQRLPRVTKCSSISLGLHNSDRNTMQMHILEHVGPGPLAPRHGTACRGRSWWLGLAASTAPYLHTCGERNSLPQSHADGSPGRDPIVLRGSAHNCTPTAGCDGSRKQGGTSL